MNINKELFAYGEKLIEEIILDPEREPLKRYLFGADESVDIDTWKLKAVSMVKQAREAIVKEAMASESRRTWR